jgi:hypothetical protein
MLDSVFPGMTPRHIKDANGVLWIVWQVTPELSPRRDADTEPIAIAWGRKLDTPATQRAGYSDGWLAFKCATQRRRLTPFPKGWSWKSDDELVELLARATPAPEPRALLR